MHATVGSEDAQQQVPEIVYSALLASAATKLLNVREIYATIDSHCQTQNDLRQTQEYLRQQGPRSDAYVESLIGANYAAFRLDQ